MSQDYALAAANASIATVSVQAPTAADALPMSQPDPTPAATQEMVQSNYEVKNWETVVERYIACMCERER
jgi:hypothetical protein